MTGEVLVRIAVDKATIFLLSIFFCKVLVRRVTRLPSARGGKQQPNRIRNRLNSGVIGSLGLTPRLCFSLLSPLTQAHRYCSRALDALLLHDGRVGFDEAREKGFRRLEETAHHVHRNERVQCRGQFPLFGDRDQVAISCVAAGLVQVGGL